MKKKILVTGANGQLGKEIGSLAGSYPYFDFVFLSREDMPIQNFELVRNTFSIHQPAFCVNCAAYTMVDKAETEKDLAYQVNAESVGVLAAVSKEYDAGFIHISTDYVFDGNGTVPYRPEDITNPQSVYGASKLQGELLAKEFNDQSIIIRTSWVYSQFGRNFVKTMLRLMSERDEIGVVSDQVGSPTYAADLAEAIVEIIASGKWHPGTYHYSNAGVISWYDFAVAIRDRAGLACKINPIPTSAYPTPAKRPAYSVMDTSAIKEAYGIVAKPWQERLFACMDRLK